MEKPDFETLKADAFEKLQVKLAAEDAYLKIREDFDAEIAALTTAWVAQHADVLDERENAKNAAESADALVRELAVEHYKETGEKQIGFGISVRINKTYQYDEAKAVEYSISHNMPHLLKADGTKFKKFAEITPLDFVTKGETVSAVVSYAEPK